MIKEKLKYKQETIVNFDPDKHVYYVNGTEYKSATTIIKQGLIAPGLINWKISKPMSEYRRLLNLSLDNNEALDRVKLERLYKQAMNFTDNVGSDAALVGSVVHGLVEDLIKGKNPEPDSLVFVFNFINNIINILIY